MAQSVSAAQRHRKGHPCPVCGGWDTLPRGTRRRCAGYTNEGWTRCTREEHAGNAPEESTEGGRAWVHTASSCKCGIMHESPYVEPAGTSYSAKPSTFYIYRDESGKPTIRVQVSGHGDDKNIYQHHWDEEAGDWKKGVGQKIRTIYRYPEILALPKETTVYIVEGERDVETLVRHGIEATTNIGGAGKWHLTEASAAKALVGRDVVILCDRDSEERGFTGQKHALDVLKHVRKVARSVRGPFECPGVKDITDLYAIGGSVADVVPMAWSPEKPALTLIKTPDPVWDDEEPTDPEEINRPAIMMGHRIDLVIEALERHMAKLDAGLYKRGHELVTILPAEKMPGVAEGTPIIRPMSVSALLPRVTKHVQFLAPGKDDKPPTKIAPTDRIISTFASSPPWPNVRYLAGVAESPIFRPDGTVRQLPGYDEATGYLYEPSCAYPAVPDRPTQEDARKALAELLDVFCDFPYANESSRLVPISAILSILARPAIAGPIPGHLFDASVVGSGKTLQCDVSHIIATGRTPGHANWPMKDEEQEKLLSTYANATPPGIVIDNVKGVLGGSALEQTLTSETVEFRQFSTLDLRRQPWRSVIMVSGNNVALTDDMIRRMLMSRLESPLDDPTKRTEFKRPELVEWVRAERPRLTVAALTILRAYASKGFPPTGVHLASYQAWARIVAGAIMFAGGGDVTQAQPPRERASLDDSGAAATLAERLTDLLREPRTLKSLFGALYPAPGKNDPPDGYDDVREAFEALSPAKGPAGPNTLSVAKKLGKFRGRWFGNRRLISYVDDHSKVIVWTIESR